MIDCLVNAIAGRVWTTPYFLHTVWGIQESARIVKVRIRNQRTDDRIKGMNAFTRSKQLEADEYGNAVKVPIKVPANQNKDFQRGFTNYANLYGWTLANEPELG